MSTIEERVARLETFMGNIDKITSVYANSIQEICDKYLSLLYIETYDSDNPHKLVLDGFLSELDTVADLPHNVVFNVRPSHNFAYGSGSGGTSSKIVFKRDNKILELPLKKYDTENPGLLKFLEPDDYLMGVMYGIYIDSQNIAIISSNDAGAVALQEVSRLADAVEDLSDTVEEMTTTQTVGSIAVTDATIANLSVSQAITLTNAVALPLGSTCSAPTLDSHIANKKYVDDTIAAEIDAYYTAHHLFTTGDPNTELNKPGVPERAICYKY